MISLTLPAKVEREKLQQTPIETLVEIILRQQKILEKQAEEIERLKTVRVNVTPRLILEPPRLIFEV